jgi:hypothetical protein
MLTLLAAALALAAAPRRVAAREVATGGVQTSAVGDTGRAASQAAYFDPAPARGLPRARLHRHRGRL